MEEWAHRSTSALKAGGTKRQLDGQELGPGCPSVAALTLSSMSQVNVATRQDVGRMDSGFSSESSVLWSWWERASDLTLRDPGR